VTQLLLIILTSWRKLRFSVRRKHVSENGFSKFSATKLLSPPWLQTLRPCFIAHLTFVRYHCPCTWPWSFIMFKIKYSYYRRNDAIIGVDITTLFVYTHCTIRGIKCWKLLPVVSKTGSYKLSCFLNRDSK